MEDGPEQDDTELAEAADPKRKLMDRRTEILRGFPIRASQDVLDHLRQLVPRLHRAEQEVARIILDEPQWVINQPIKALARRAKVSEPTVMRLCRKLDLEGFSAFKIKLAQDLVVSDMLVLAEDSTQSGHTSIAERAQKRAAQAMHGTVRALTDSLLFRAGELVVSANRVFCLPLEAQALPMAEDAQNRLFGLGIASQTVTDPLRQEAVASAAGPGDLFVFFATDGGRSSGKESAESAKRGGGSILALVPGEHELAGIADLLLPMDGLSNRSGERRSDEILHAQLLAVTCLESATRNVQQAHAAE